MGPPQTLVSPALSPTGGGARPSAAPYGGGVGGALLVGGPGPARGVSRVTGPSSPPRAHRLGLPTPGVADTCVAACVGAGAAAAVGSAGGSTSG